MQGAASACNGLSWLAPLALSVLRFLASSSTTDSSLRQQKLVQMSRQMEGDVDDVGLCQWAWQVRPSWTDKRSSWPHPATRNENGTKKFFRANLPLVGRNLHLNRTTPRTDDGWISFSGRQLGIFYAHKSDQSTNQWSDLNLWVQRVDNSAWKDLHADLPCHWANAWCGVQRELQRWSVCLSVNDYRPAVSGAAASCVCLLVADRVTCSSYVPDIPPKASSPYIYPVPPLCCPISSCLAIPLPLMVNGKRIQLFVSEMGSLKARRTAGQSAPLFEPCPDDFPCSRGTTSLPLIQLILGFYAAQYTDGERGLRWVFPIIACLLPVTLAL